MLYSDENIQVHDTVFAMFPHDDAQDRYFWGRVIRIRQQWGDLYYDVWFYDNDVRVNIPRAEIYHESEVVRYVSCKKNLIRRVPQDMSVNPNEDKNMIYQRQRLRNWWDVTGSRCGSCKSCISCTKKSANNDCNCRGCTTQTNALACIRLICEVAIRDHLFCLPACFPTCWSLRLKKRRNGTSTMPFVVDAKGNEITSKGIAKALISCGHTIFQIQECCNQLFEVDCGCLLDTKVSTLQTALVDQRWSQECLDPHGSIITISGTIIDCKPGLANQSWEYVLSIDDDVSSSDGHVAQSNFFATLSKADADRGVVNFKRRKNENVGHRALGAWLVPTNFQRQEIGGEPIVCFEYDRCHFKLSRCISGIPNAGFGLFAEISTHDPERKTFILPKGCILDIGVYGPVSEDDYKDERVYAIKNFLYQHQPAVYGFASKRARHVIDVLDDANCEMKPMAKSSLLPYANENVEPSLEVQYDAYGLVHYTLGSCHGALSLPLNKKVELHVGFHHNQCRITHAIVRWTTLMTTKRSAFVLVTHALRERS